VLLDKLRDGLFGSITVAAKGERLEKFLNSAYAKGVILWDIRRPTPTSIVFKMNPWTFRRLRKAVRSSQTKVKVVERQGAPFFWQKILKRKGILVGVALCSLILYVLSTFIWFIDVAGNKKMNELQVLQVAQSLGLKTGIFRSRVDTSRVAREMKEKLPLAAWVGVSVHGTRVVIEIVEKVEKPAPKAGKGNLTAAKSGLVTDVLVIKGTSQIQEGQTVKSGQTLILADNGPVAQGFVRARIWNSGTGIAKLKEEGVKETGNTSDSLRIKIGTKVIILTGKQSPFKLYKEEQSSKSLPQWRNIRIPVEIITVHYREIATYKREMSREEALNEAKEMAKADIAAKIPPDVKVISKKETLFPSKDPNLVKFMIDVETLEDIAVHTEN
jgi:similar to stage IV sporulation protein